MARKFDFERASAILAESAMLGQKATCQKHNISDRTLRSWQQRLQIDPVFAEYCRRKKEALTQDWANQVGGAILSAIAFLKRACAEADPKDPEVIHAIAGAYKLLADSAIAKQVLDARLNKPNHASP